MAHEDTIYGLMEKLVIADKHVIGDLMSHKGIWTKGTSSVNNSYKALNLLVDSGKLIKGDGFFKLPTCKSEYKEHAQLLSKILATVIKFNPDCLIKREYTISSVGLRPDSLVVLRRSDKGYCLVIEAVNNEPEDYFQQKIHTWDSWDEAPATLSALFGYRIPHFDIIKAENPEDMKTYLEAL